MSALTTQVKTEVLTETALLEDADAAVLHSKLGAHYKEPITSRMTKKCQLSNIVGECESGSAEFTKLSPPEKPTLKKLDFKRSVYRCLQCKLSFTSNHSRRRHMQRSIHTGILPYKCQECKACYVSKRSLNSHIRNLHTEKHPFLCSECSGTFSRAESLKIHILTIHNGHRPYLCKICGNSFGQKGNFDGHMRTHSGEKPFKCQVCGKGFKQRQTLNLHRRRHTGVKPYKCTEKQCNKAFIDTGSLRKHVKVVHVDTEKKIKCEQCCKIFKTKLYLQAHVKAMHSKIRPFACTICSSSFKQKSHLQKHMKCIHFKEQKFFLCKQCGAEFRNVGHLKNHVRLKHKDRVDYLHKNVACQQCDLVFFQACELEFHIKNNHSNQLQECRYHSEKCDCSFIHSETTAKPGTRPDEGIEHVFASNGSVNEQNVAISNRDDTFYQCELCSSKFKQINSMMRHIKLKHAGVRVLKCDLCKYSFTTKRHLQKHINNCKGDKNATSEESGFKRVELERTKNYIQTNCMEKLVNNCTVESHSLTTQTTDENFVPQSRPNPASDLKRLERVVNHCENGCLNGSRKCKQCKATFEKIGCLISHTRMQHSRKRHQRCKRYTSVVTRRSQLKKRASAIHNIKERHVKCKECEATFTQPWRLKKHTEVVHSKEIIGQIKYEILDNEYSLENKLQQPVGEYRNAEMDSVFSPLCKFCGMKFVQPAHLIAHIQALHSDEVPSGESQLLDMVNDSGLFQCTYCPAAFIQADDLLTHVKVEHENELIICKTEPEDWLQKEDKLQQLNNSQACEKLAANNSPEEVNSVQHGWFECEFCGAEFVLEPHLLTHIMIHHWDRSKNHKTQHHECLNASGDIHLHETVVNITTVNHGTEGSVVRHVSSKCTYCDAEFVQEGDLIAHVNLQHKTCFNSVQMTSNGRVQDSIVLSTTVGFKPDITPLVKVKNE